MADQCNPRMVSNCGTVTLKEAEQTKCQPFSFCLPFGGKVDYDGTCMHYAPGTPPEDGVYSKIYIANGCIVGADKYDPPIYTNSPCAPVPNPCDCEGGGTGSLPDPSTQSGNLFQYDASGRPLVKVTINGGSGVTVSGSGSTTDPFVISAKPDSTIGLQYFKAGNDGLILSGSGTQQDPYSYAHKTGYQANVLGMTFDQYGHLTGYIQPSSAGTVNGVIGEDGITAETELSSGVVTLTYATPVRVLQGEYYLGAYKMELDGKNRVIGMERNITFPANEYTLGNYNVTVNEYGSLTSIESIQTAGIVTASASKKFTQNTGEMNRIMTFTTAADSAFRISYKSTTIPSDIQVYVDDIVYDGNLIGNSYEVLTNSTMRAGTHVVSVQTANDTGFSGIGYLDVVMTVTV